MLNKRKIFYWIRQGLCVIAFGVTASYLFNLHEIYNAEMEKPDQGVYSDVIDISQKKTIEWVVPKENWPDKTGRAELSLVLDNGPDVPFDTIDGKKIQLRIRVKATGILETKNNFFSETETAQILKRHPGYDRLIQDWWYTDKPFDGKIKLPSSGSYKHPEYTIGAVYLVPWEQTKITIEVINPQPEMNARKPRLKLASHYDLVAHKTTMMRHTVYNLGFLISVTMLVVLFLLSLRWPVKNQSA